jgi:hypothetical protein
MSEQREVELDAGPIAYLESGGDRPPLVVLHGLPLGGCLSAVRSNATRRTQNEYHGWYPKAAAA